MGAPFEQGRQEAILLFDLSSSQTDFESVGFS